MRANANYTIISSERLNATEELVIGYNEKAPAPYVCWYCKSGNDYYWGMYCGTLKDAMTTLEERLNR